MSIKVCSLVWEKSRHKGSTLLLLLAIADFAHDDGTGAWPSVATLSTKTRQTRRNVQRLLRELEESGEVTTIQGGGPYGSNAYAINLELLNQGGDKLTPPPVEEDEEEELPGDDAAAAGDDSTAAGGATPRAPEARQLSPNPLLKPSIEPSQEDLSKLRKVSPALTIVDKPVDKSQQAPGPRGDAEGAGAWSDEIAFYAEELTRTVLNDAAHLQSNVSNAINRWRESGFAVNDFIGLMDEAKVRTLKHSASIQSPPDRKAHNRRYGQKNRAPYFFAVLKDLLENGAEQSETIIEENTS